MKYVVLCVAILNLVSCTDENAGCETETVCYGADNCIEKPIPGTCF